MFRENSIYQILTWLALARGMDVNTKTDELERKRNQKSEDESKKKKQEVYARYTYAKHESTQAAICLFAFSRSRSRSLSPFLSFSLLSPQRRYNYRLGRRRSTGMTKNNAEWKTNLSPRISLFSHWVQLQNEWFRQHSYRFLLDSSCILELTIRIAERWINRDHRMSSNCGRPTNVWDEGREEKTSCWTNDDVRWYL